MTKPKFQDPNGRHIRVYCSLLNSPAFRVLSRGAKALFFDLRKHVTGTNNGNISATLTLLKHDDWTSPATLARALYELRSMGFLAVTRNGGLKMGTRVCTLYRFTDLDVYDQPKVGVERVGASHDYQQFKSVDEARKALEEGIAKLKAEGKEKQMSRKKSLVQKLNRISSKSEAIDPFISSETEHSTPSSVQKLNSGKAGRNQRKAA